MCWEVSILNYNLPFRVTCLWASLCPLAPVVPLCILLQEGPSEFSVPPAPQLPLSSAASPVGSRGLLALDPFLWGSLVKSRAQNVTRSSRWTLNSPGSAESWLEIFFLSACVGTELAPLQLPAPVSRPVLLQWLQLTAGGALSRHGRSPGSVERMARRLP